MTSIRTPLRRVAGLPVSAESFRRILAAMEELWRTDEHLKSVKEEVRKKERQCRNHFEKIAQNLARWPTQEDEYATIGPEPPKGLITVGSLSTFQTLAVYMNRTLALACKQAGFDKCASISKAGKSFRIQWEEYDRTSNSELPAMFTRRSPCIKLIRGDPSGGAFRNSYMRGFYALAAEWGVEIQSTNISARFEERALQDLIDDTIARADERQVDAIVVTTANPAVINVQIGRAHDVGIHLVTSGFDMSPVRVNENQVGTSISDELARVERQRFPDLDRPVLLLYPADAPGSPIEQRLNAIRQTLRRHLGRDERLHEKIAQNADEARTTVLALLSDGDRADLCAIVALTTQVTDGALEALRFRETFKGSPSAIHVYATDYTSRTITQLRAADGTLRAACGTDAFYYGRFLLRAALSGAAKLQEDRTAGDTIRYVAAKPVLIARDEVLARQVHNTQEVANAYPVVKLNDRPYAWDDWMRHLSPRGFGPDHSPAE